MRRVAKAIVFAAVVAPNLIGLPYFLLPIAQRVRHPLHPWFKSSGYVGQTAGILTLALFLFMYLYPLRKRWRLLSRVGSQARWLEVHIVAGLLIPLAGALHAGWRFQGLIGVGYLAMLMVSVSGVAGRYVYTRIPRGTSGRELTDAEVVERQRSLEHEIAGISGRPPEAVRERLAAAPVARGLGWLAALKKMISADLNRRSRAHALVTEWTGRRLDRQRRAVLERLVRERVALGQQRRMLEATRRLFGYWHTVHRPFSVTSFIAVVIHVVVVVALGVTWF